MKGVREKEEGEESGMLLSMTAFLLSPLNKIQHTSKLLLLSTKILLHYSQCLGM